MWSAVRLDGTGSARVLWLAAAVVFVAGIGFQTARFVWDVADPVRYAAIAAFWLCLAGAGALARGAMGASRGTEPG